MRCLVNALKVDPIFEMLGRAEVGSSKELLSLMAGEAFIARHASGGGCIPN